MVCIVFSFSETNASPQTNENLLDKNQIESVPESTQAYSLEKIATPVKEADAKISSQFTVTNNFVDPDNNCEFCTRIVYSPGKEGEAGLAYRDSTLDLDKSQRLVFFMKSQQDEQASFVAAGNLSLIHI